MKVNGRMVPAVDSSDHPDQRAFGSSLMGQQTKINELVMGFKARKLLAVQVLH